MKGLLKSLILTCLVVAPTANAGTFFDELTDLYDQGSKPEITRMLNRVLTGRCFYHEKPNEPKALVVHTRLVTNRALGSLGQRIRRYEWFGLVNYSPEYYDGFDLHRLTEEIPRTRVSPNYHPINLSNQNEIILQSNNNPDVLSVRINENYLILKASGRNGHVCYLDV